MSEPWNRSGAATPPLDADLPADGSAALRVVISAVYAAVSAAGLLGNVLVLVLMGARRGRKRSSSIHLFILHLAVTDLQFALTLPFWAVDTALDFSWPFGDAMCRVVLSVTVLNMYASVFLLSAMSVSRYCALTSALSARPGAWGCPVRWVIAALWLAAAAATAPTALFSAVRSVAGEPLCLLRFPDGRDWLALYHLQKIVLGFVLPMAVVSVCYLLLLRVVRLRSMSSTQVRRRSRVTRSVTIIVLSFFVCWMPNHAITLWGVLVKLNVAQWDRSYYAVHTYVHPLSVCLAHTNSCLNPLLYCLMRPEFRKKLKELFWTFSSPGRRRHPSPSAREEYVAAQAAVPLDNMETERERL